MLRRLAIRDFVIVDRLELEFAPGFGTLTGETGAGKSILVDALGLALGDRSDATTVRAGRDKADIVAEFDLPPDGALAAWLDAADLAGEDVVMLRRVVDAGGRSRSWINGVPVTLAQLREAGEWLADIHGQHAHLALLRADAQRALLDAQAGAGALVAQVERAHREWQRIARLRLQAEHDASASERQRELLSWQIDELAQLAFEADEWVELDAEQRRLAHAAALITGSDEALSGLVDDEMSVTSLLGRILVRVEAMHELDPEVGEARELLAGAAIQIDEAVHALRRYHERLDLDPDRLAEVERRIGAINDVARKHHVAPHDLPELLTRWQLERDELEARSDPARLAELESSARQAWFGAAEQLSRQRRPAAQALSEQVTEAMQSLAMAGGRFEVALVAREEGGAHGLEDIEFRVAASPGQPLRPLAKVASGGELSRIGLAIQVMTSRDTAVPTLIFDEVDVGIGGSVAERVGQLLARLGSDRQVLCVTHLPQVAACADWQWNIAKRSGEGEVLSAVTPLDAQARIDEVARMLGGLEITATTREHASEMLTRARERARVD
ncbi:DNA repair protein RecN [Pseudazoarcus pumilus]|uniref:DNA repair protein RecN n=1 Tax=Pseudazoarcus pumilus TaxID=2067960 RepID=A0A2I6S670_9RHOO|nr:DNA repair protein RecN [Pseudazoarcus pumilus]AUN94756.1 DNA repair protein RecN [Pseudazoarcus pumilus]